MQIGELAARTGVPAKTIRYYESIDLIEPPARAGNGYRDYGNDDVQTLRFVQRARQLGFSLKEVDGLLDLWRNNHRASSDVKKLALERIEAIEERMRDLESMRQTLVRLTRLCHGDDRPECPIIETLEDGRDAAGAAAPKEPLPAGDGVR